MEAQVILTLAHQHNDLAFTNFTQRPGQSYPAAPNISCPEDTQIMPEDEDDDWDSDSDLSVVVRQNLLLRTFLYNSGASFQNPLQDLERLLPRHHS